MTKLSLTAYPHMLGFEPLANLLERTAKSGSEGYPPFNIEQTTDQTTRATKGETRRLAAMPALVEPGALDVSRLDDYIRFCTGFRVINYSALAEMRPAVNH